MEFAEFSVEPQLHEYLLAENQPAIYPFYTLAGFILSQANTLPTILFAGQGRADSPRPKIRGSIKKGPPKVPRPPTKPLPVPAPGRRGK